MACFRQRELQVKKRRILNYDSCKASLYGMENSLFLRPGQPDRQHHGVRCVSHTAFYDKRMNKKI